MDHKYFSFLEKYDIHLSRNTRGDSRSPNFQVLSSFMKFGSLRRGQDASGMGVCQQVPPEI